MDSLLGHSPEGRTVLITGAGGALGTAVNRAFEQAGWSLVLLALNSAEEERLRRTHPKALIAQADLSDESRTREAFAAIVDSTHSVAGLVNLVGGFEMSPAEETPKAELERMLARNFWAPINATRALLPHLLERGSGFVIGIGSAPGLDGGAGVSSYAASKGALIAYLRSLRKELAPKGILVSLVHPMGAFDTPQNRASMPDADPQEWIDPQEIAATILHLAGRGTRGGIDEVRVLPPGGG